MYKYNTRLAVFAIFLMCSLKSMGQNIETDCNPLANLPITNGDVNLYYGSSNAVSFRNRTSVLVGQPAVDISQTADFNSGLGYYMRFLLSPAAPIVNSSGGDFPDRVLISWDVDPLSSFSEKGFTILRDGAFLAEVGPSIRQFIDFNVQAGELYNYSVFGSNQFGDGVRANAVGFVNPNGTVSGTVNTLSGNPVPGAVIRLLPLAGTSLAFDGINDHVCVSYSPVLPTNMWTLSTYVKIGSNAANKAIVDYGSHLNKNFWLHTSTGGGGKGITAGVGTGISSVTLTHTFVENPDGWHQVSMVYNGSSLLLYVDGKFVNSAQAIISNVNTRFTIGSTIDGAGYFNGNIDDIRIYNKPLTATEIFQTKELSPSRSTDGLVAYFKFDEGQGKKVFDISSSKLQGFLLGPTFSTDKAPVINAGITDVKGFYSIDGVNYSKSEQFTAIPSKSFYQYSALEFNAAYESRVDLTDFDISDSFTIEIVVHPLDLQSRQSLLTYGTDFDYYIHNNNTYLDINGQTILLEAASASYKHVAFRVLDGTLDYFENGSLIGQHSLSSSSMDFSGNTWRLGSSQPPYQYYYTGLIDEFAYYDDALSIQDIQLHASPVDAGGTDIGHAKLKTWFSLDEGEDLIVEDFGSNATGLGNIINATFSTITYRQKELVHLFRPSERKIVINTSNTAISGVDFTDESTIPVSGVVRFENTFCYQDSVEILVNGQSYFPAIFTDASGRFVADFEPGQSIILRPKYGTEDDNHKFSPPFYEARKLNRPIASVLFANQTKRIIQGQLSGGDGKLSVISVNAMGNINQIVRMKVASTNLCYEKEITLDETDGKFVFTELPALPMTTVLTLHTDNTIFNYFDDGPGSGGKNSDMRLKKRDTLDFRYYAPPQVWMEPFDETVCPGGGITPYPTIDESTPSNGHRLYKKTMRMYEDYPGGRDWLKNFRLEMTNNLNDESIEEIVVKDTSAYKYEFYVGQANIAGDFSKFMQAKGISPRGQQHVVVQRAIVLGERARESSFVTKSPEVPILILRDPPGDGSSATWEKGQTHCASWSSMAFLNSNSQVEKSLKKGTKLTLVKGVGVAKVTDIEGSATYGYTGSFKTNTESEYSGEWCNTLTRTLTTSGADAVMGDDADLYYGAAINFRFSANDVLYLDLNTCQVKSDSTTVRVDPAGFATEFIYSQWQINGSVIPNLELTGDTATADSWREAINRNNRLKKDAKFGKNLTFDGLASYQESSQTTSTNSVTINTTLEWSVEKSVELGLELDGKGFGQKISFELGGGVKIGGGYKNEKNVTVTYNLADDDPNDSYTIDVKDDPVYGTPVFVLRAGESMCPWVPGTLNREEIGLQIDRLTAVDVPENDAAIFKIKMSNLGQTGRDPLVYVIGQEQGTNPDGAIFLVDGEVLINPIPVQLQPKETKEFLLAIYKGPDANIYEYNNLGIFVASACQRAHSFNLGYNLGAYANWEINNPGVPRPIKSDNVMEGIYNIVDLDKFYKNVKLNVEFQEPCSPINIGFPFQDWVQTPALGDNLTISLNSFINDDPDLELIRVQYRRTGGDGAWVNITEILKSELTNPVSKNITWDMSELADGPYEIRAITQCFSGLNAGISEVIKGRKETKPPKIFGKPQPADGLLSPGDEISITFSKRINCDMIFPADGIGTNINLNNMALQDMTLGGILIDADFVCKDDKIVIIPRISQRFIENHTLRVTATGIKDLYSNPIPAPIVWEFYVNQSNLYWHGGDIDEVVLEGNELMVRREIRNQSGERTSFLIENYPDWMQIFPTAGTLDPGQILPVNFVFPADLVNGAYSTTVQMSTIDGDEPMKVDLRVACPQPEWAINSAEYSYSMNITAQLNIEGILSTDRLDRIGAFINGELRGIGRVEYSKELNKHMVFLTIYSNLAVGETVIFKIWDASACQLYGVALESFPFVADGIIGNLQEPQIIHTIGIVEKKIQIIPGWNWLSYNIELSNSAINPALSSLSSPQGGLFKSQVQFSTFSSAINSWLGSLNQLSYTNMYQYNSMSRDSLLLLGAPVEQSTPLPMIAGWNWISYLPQFGLPISTALSSLSPLNGDIIKSQENFAQYLAGVGWIGNLKFLNTPNGYLLRLSNSDLLIYPSVADLNNVIDSEGNNKNRESAGYVENTRTDLGAKLQSQVEESHWSVMPQDFEFNMNAIAVVVKDDLINMLKDGDEVGAFVGNEIRGVGKAMYIEELDKYMLFMTLYANKEGEQVTFKYFSKQENKEYPIDEFKGFQINSIWGMVENPVVLHLSGTSSTEDNQHDSHFRLYPNPTANYLNVEFASMGNEDVVIKIVDMLGKEVKHIPFKAVPGINLLEWSNLNEVKAGVYWIKLLSSQGEIVRKFTIIK
ncbi:MAG: T9SS type A sorting domain-containing protein [Saprospiraceae bacterium]|nr:T9SS type A sorting domain-containing protein [Saprospiraceae bacterium]